MGNNREALERGFAKAKDIIRQKMESILVREANVLALKAHDLYKSPRMAFTGNTWTGTAVGAYSNGKLVYYVTTKMIADMDPAIRNKLKKGERVFLNPDYMGRARSFTGVINTDSGNSENDAITFLLSHNPNSRYAITVVNGSEYAEYIEQVLDGDVITGTYHYAGNLRAIDLIK